MIYTEVNEALPLWVSILAAIIILTVLIGLFIYSYIANRKTPKPEGCEENIIACAGCQVVACGHRKELGVQETSIEAEDDK
ncbi:MAG: hypothetical protein GX350_01455 [Erysipelotrichaceae bacterium]|nr:hypothetical protein [Erysipelotrichaceae bacterium]